MALSEAQYLRTGEMIKRLMIKRRYWDLCFDALDTARRSCLRIDGVVEMAFLVYRNVSLNTRHALRLMTNVSSNK